MSESIEPTIALDAQSELPGLRAWAIEQAVTWTGGRDYHPDYVTTVAAKFVRYVQTGEVLR